jgi:hypothetical protein
VTKSSKVLIAALIGLVVLGCLGSAAATAFIFGGIADFGGDGVWKLNGIPESRWHPAFGVKLPGKPVKAIGREMGFQDVYVEVIIELSPGALQGFLDANALVRGPSRIVDPGIVKEIDAMHGGLKLNAFDLELPEATSRDGGFSGLNRQATIYEAAGGEAFLHLVAFDT